MQWVTSTVIRYSCSCLNGAIGLIAVSLVCFLFVFSFILEGHPVLSNLNLFIYEGFTVFHGTSNVLEIILTCFPDWYFSTVKSPTCFDFDDHGLSGWMKPRWWKSSRSSWSLLGVNQNHNIDDSSRIITFKYEFECHAPLWMEVHTCVTRLLRVFVFIPKMLFCWLLYHIRNGKRSDMT